VFEDLNYEELRRRANPPLPDRVLATLESRGERRSVPAGETLFRTDDRQYPFVYSISTVLQIRDPDGLVLKTMEPGQHSGEFGLLLGQTAFADCVTVTPGEVLLVAPLTIAELVVVVGGGNSAGQAAMFLASRASRVRLVHRGRDLSDSMSQYLIERLRHAANVRIETNSQVVGLAGDEHLRRVKIRDRAGNVAENCVGGLFIMIGADPCTEWVKEAIRLDDRGFVLTGEDCGADAAVPFNGFQTSLPGVFAVGDVRSGSVKRVASAVGEGSVVVQAIHARLASLRQAEAREPVTL